MDITPNKGYKKPSLTDNYSVADMNFNTDIDDEYPQKIENENGICYLEKDGRMECFRTLSNFDRTLAGYQQFFFAKKFVAMPVATSMPTVGNYGPYVKSCSTTVTSCDPTFSKWIIQVIDFTTSGYNLPLYAHAVGRWK